MYLSDFSTEPVTHHMGATWHALIPPVYDTHVAMVNTTLTK